MFKFNFQSSDSECTSKNIEGEEEETSIQWLEAREHVVNDEHRLIASKLEDGIRIDDEMGLKLVDTDHSSTMIIAEKDALTQTLHSDLVRGVYEGGLKVWECSRDLANFVGSFPFPEKSTFLELGCGAGLPGLKLMSRGFRVDFQDYNPEVIDFLTIPNVLLNSKDFQSRFYSGDWGFLQQSLGKNGYDFIITSETIYDLNNQVKLLTLFDSCLKDDGHVFLAAKSHYFGVGGGLRQFEKRAMSNWTYETVFKVQSGVSREIIKMSKKTKKVTTS